MCSASLRHAQRFSVQVGACGAGGSLSEHRRDARRGEARREAMRGRGGRGEAAAPCETRSASMPTSAAKSRQMVSPCEISSTTSCSGMLLRRPVSDTERRAAAHPRKVQFTGLAQTLGQHHASDRYFQSNCWENLKFWANPVNFAFGRGRRQPVRWTCPAPSATPGSPRSGGGWRRDFPSSPGTTARWPGTPRVRSHCRLRNRRTEYVSASGIKRISGSCSTKRQCDRALGAPPRSAWPTGRPP
jgi:hypothetical protein